MSGTIATTAVYRVALSNLVPPPTGVSVSMDDETAVLRVEFDVPDSPGTRTAAIYNLIAGYDAVLNRDVPAPERLEAVGSHDATGETLEFSVEKSLVEGYIAGEYDEDELLERVAAANDQLS